MSGKWHKHSTCSLYELKLHQIGLNIVFIFEFMLSLAVGFDFNTKLGVSSAPSTALAGTTVAF